MNVYLNSRANFFRYYPKFGKNIALEKLDRIFFKHNEFQFHRTPSQLRTRHISSLQSLQVRRYGTTNKKNTKRDNVYVGPLGWVNTGTIIKLGGGGTIAIIIALATLYFYCEECPDQMVCTTIREKLGVKNTNSIPKQADFIVTREKPLQKIQGLLTDQTSGKSIVAIVGDSGKGKTELAKQFAEAKKKEYLNRWFIDANNWQEEYRNLACELKLITIGEKDTYPIHIIIKEIHKKFEEQTLLRKKSLIIFDNAPDNFIGECLKGQLPNNTDILITSKIKSQCEYEIDLGKDEESAFTIEEGLKIFQKRIQLKDSEIPQATEIINRFNNSPVAISQAASYLAKTQIEIEDYLKRFDQDKKSILSQGSLKRPDRIGNIDVYVSISMTIKEIEKDSPEALDLLNHCAYLPSQDIPKSLLEKLTKSPSELDKLLWKLQTLIIPEKNFVTIHSLVQEIVQMMIEKKAERQILSDLGKIAEEFIPYFRKDPNKAREIFFEGIRSERLKDTPNTEKIANLLVALGNVQIDLGETIEAHDNLNEALDIFIKIGANPFTFARTYDLLGKTQILRQEYEAALENLTKSLHLKKELFGENHIEVAKCYANIGVTQAHLGRYETAVEYEDKALKFYEDTLGIKSPYILTHSLKKFDVFSDHLRISIYASFLDNFFAPQGDIYEQLGDLYRDLGENTTALGCYRSSISWSFNDKNKLAIRYDKIGIVQHILGNYEKALDSQSKALELKEKLLGENDVDVAKSYANIAVTYAFLKNYKSAFLYKEKAVKFYEEYCDR